jgi:beta-xylosidase
MMKKGFFLLVCLPLLQGKAQELPKKTEPSVSKVWVSDLGNGNYKNPVINADYSDPDAIRVGADFYMTASSFDAVPGLPILHSRDLVNWTLINHALPLQVPVEHFSKTRPGKGVWAPAIRYHKGTFYIYYPDPDFGIYMIKTQDPASSWSKPLMVQEGKGLIDPCPFWDEDGRVYLAYAFAGSRAGLKSILAIEELEASGEKPLGQGRIVYDGHELDPTIEGPKLYKRNGYYYLFAPAGGVSAGWQLVLRSKNIYGPYERKVVMDQGKTNINGPHQGAWVDTEKGEDWFLHFQDKGMLGRVVHLQPMKWIRDWPVIGSDPDGDGKGEPVMTFRKPAVGGTYPPASPAESDEFNRAELGLQWQWQANPKETWFFADQNKGKLRLYTVALADSSVTYRDVPNLLLQKFPSQEFTATSRLNFCPDGKQSAEKTGLIVMGRSYAGLVLKSRKDGRLELNYVQCQKAAKGGREKEQLLEVLEKTEIWFRVKVSEGGSCVFSYSSNGKDFKTVAAAFSAQQGEWIGAKLGLFATKSFVSNDSGYTDVDWFRIEKN